MKTISKIAVGSALAAILMYAPANLNAYPGGYHGGYRGGAHWGLSIGWPGYYGYPYYPYDYSYYPPVMYYQAPVQYYSVPAEAVYSSPMTSVSNSPAPPVNNELVKPAPQPPATPPVQPMRIADVRALVKAGLADEVVISQIKQSRAVFRLTTEEIIDLKKNGVSNKVLEFMINTPNQ